MTDTDSFVYQIKTDDFYEDMKGMKEHNDMSEYSKESGLYDGETKKVIGKFKDESPDEVIESFVGIRSKCYSFITKNNVVKKAKGVSKVVVKKKTMTHRDGDNHLKCRFLGATMTTPFTGLFIDASCNSRSSHGVCVSRSVHPVRSSYKCKTTGTEL